MFFLKQVLVEKRLDVSVAGLDLFDRVFEKKDPGLRKRAAFVQLLDDKVVFTPGHDIHAAVFVAPGDLLNLGAATDVVNLCSVEKDAADAPVLLKLNFMVYIKCDKNQGHLVNNVLTHTFHFWHTHS